MKKIILPVTLLFLAFGCLDANDDHGFDNTADLEFLEENAGKEGVIVTDSGLQYRILSENDNEENGEGEENDNEEENGDVENGEEEARQPGPNDNVMVHYQGELIDGTLFDSSFVRGEPATFALNEVIAGFSEGIQLMIEGQIFELVIPSNLAYGNNPPFGSIIHPGATLIFEVQLIEILY